jgi:molecular chaperone DnaK (HSP70)
MPEPFAVFQYYRYGVKHPLVAQRTKHIALVFDFGGGTYKVTHLLPDYQYRIKERR